MHFLLPGSPMQYRWWPSLHCCRCFVHGAYLACPSSSFPPGLGRFLFVDVFLGGQFTGSLGWKLLPPSQYIDTVFSRWAISITLPLPPCWPTLLTNSDFLRQRRFHVCEARLGDCFVTVAAERRHSCSYSSFRAAGLQVGEDAVPTCIVPPR